MQRREHGRYSIWFPVQVDSGGLQNAMALNHNIGAGGMLVALSAELKVGEDVKVTFRLPPGGKPEQKFQGRILRVEKNLEDPDSMWPYRIAVVFDEVEPELVPMNDSSLAILIFNTNVKHELSGGEYGERRAHCEEAARALGIPALRDATIESLEAAKDKLDPVVYRRARHVIGENERTTQAADAIRAGQWNKLGQLMYASHDSLRDDYEVSCAELDVVVDLAREIGTGGGVYGCRMTGGGFGGCTVALVKASSVDAISKKLVDGYKRKVGIDPAVFLSHPAGGATVIKA